MKGSAARCEGSNSHRDKYGGSRKRPCVPRETKDRESVTKRNRKREKEREREGGREGETETEMVVG